VNERASVIANFVGFQVNWFACVLGAAAGAPLVGPAVVATLLAIHLRLRRAWRPELLLVVLAGVIGYVADSALVLAGVFGFTDPARLGWPSTIWMVCLWMSFAATLRASLGWLRGRYALAAVFGAVGGPLAYWAGARFGAIEFGDAMARGLALVALEYLLAMPLLVWIERRTVGEPSS
jgi:hypothetical protein